MNMKAKIVRMLSGLIMATAFVMSAYAADGNIDTLRYKICPGDTIRITEVNPARTVVVFRDTVWSDTIRVIAPTMDSIHWYVVNVYPNFEKTETKELEVGQTISWCDTVIDKAGVYERRYQSQINGCDSIHRLIVKEKQLATVVTDIVDTLCAGSSMTFGGQTLTTGGVYFDTIHLSHYDSVTVLTLNLYYPDTVVQTSRIPEGTSVTWHGEEYSEPGLYDKLYTNRFGCDSLSRLELIVYHIDTIDTTAIICPSTTITWHGMTYGQSGNYEFPGVRDNGDKVYYRLHLTVKELIPIDTLFTLCDEESINFHGKTYVNAGEYFDQYTCDTLYKITVVKHPAQLHLQTGVLDRTHPYYWQYMLDGEAKTDTIDTPGLYEYTTHNPETGCNDIWRLILTKDETIFHFVENVTICESEDYSWRGREHLNRLGIGQTIHYYDRYRTVADQDSIYELVLTVKPVQRRTQTLRFCESIILNGKTYDKTQVVVDTFTSVVYQCDSIVTTFLEKGEVFHVHDTATIVPGETIEWRGKVYDHDGLFEEKHLSAAGCDSIYSIGIGYKDAPPVTNTR